MKNKFLLLLFFLTTLGVFSQEKGLNVSVTGGLSTPLGEYKTESMPNITENYGNMGTHDFFGYQKNRKGGFFYNIDVNYRFGKAGMGLSLGSFNHEITDIKYNITLPTEFQGGKLSGFYYGIGPNYNIGFSKLQFTLMLRAGMVNYKYDGFKAFYAGSDITTPIEILDSQLKADAKTNISYGSFAVKLSYPISKNLSVFTKFDLLKSLGKGLEVKDTYYLPFDIDSNDTITAFDVAHFMQIDLKREDTRFIKPQMLNVGVGLTYTFNPSAPKSRKDNKSEEKVYNAEEFSPSGNDDCYPVDLSEKNRQKDFVLSKKQRPDFEWTDVRNVAKPKKYILKLFDENKHLIFSKETTKNKVSHSKELEAIYKKYATGTKPKKVFWTVTSVFEKCGEKTSKESSFTVKSYSSGLDMDFRNVYCDEPAFDNDGYVHYTGEVYFENSPNNNTSVTITNQTFTLTDTSNANSTNANIIPCNNSLSAFPFTLAPGQSRTICFEFKRPFGETDSALHVHYYNGNNSQLTMEEIQTENLPNCVCNYCDKFKYQLEHNVETVSYNNSNIGNLLIKDNLKITGWDNVKQVTAEVIAFSHKTNNKQCFTCSKDDDNMAMFRKNQSRFITNPSGWANNGKAVLQGIANNDDYGNSLLWRVSDNTGVDFSTPQKVLLKLNIPKKSQLDCCYHQFNICIRYTFTDVNCKTCSAIICYSFESGNKPSGGSDTVDQIKDVK